MINKPMQLTYLIIALFASAIMAGQAYAEEYRLGGGDVVLVTVYEHDDLTTEDRITDLGYITVPLLGGVDVDNLTKSEAEKFIEEQLVSRDLIRNPSVTVRVVQYRSRSISILGMVAKPGNYSLDKASSILDLLAQAGGILPDGDERIRLLRKEGEDTRKIDIDLRSMFERGIMDHNLNVINGDVIYVARAPVFYIYGEVQRQGAYRLERDMSVLQALSVGGGLTSRGKDNGLKIERRDADGQIQSVSVGLDELVKANDVIRVKERLF